MTIAADRLTLTSQERITKIDRAREAASWIAGESDRLSSEATIELSYLRRILRELRADEGARVALVHAVVPSLAASPARGRVES